MPIDGCFIHYLSNELNNTLKNAKINRIYQPSQMDTILEVRSNNKNYKLLISSNLNTPRIHLTNYDFQNPSTPYNFCMVLRKYIERGIITNILQYENDRIIKIDIASHNELDDEVSYSLIFEMMGRNTNLILVDSNYIIIDSIRKLSPSLDNERIILPHAQYIYKESLNKVNPFNINESSDLLDLQGLSKILRNKFNSLNYTEIQTFLNQKLNPVIFLNNDKLDFYAYPICDNCKILSSYNTLSELLESFYQEKLEVNKSNSYELETLVKKEIKKSLVLKEHLEEDLLTAKENLLLQDKGILLQANLYKVHKGDKEVIVNNFLNNNEEITITLDPLLDPSVNLNKIFNKVKKAKSALVKVNEQLDKVKNELDYLNNILFELSIASNDEIDQIKKDLFDTGYIKKKKLNLSRKIKINILHYEVEDCIIYVGKNNMQNDYLTHNIASSNDLWFHAKDIPGSHVIIKVPNNEKDYNFSENLIRTAANLAAYYSKGKTSSSVPVDYTLVKYIKKIPGVKGYHVTFTHQKTIYIDPVEYKK